MTEGQVLEALRLALAQSPGPDDAYTTAELAQKLGASVARTRDALRRLIAAGQAESIQIPRPRLDGIVARVSAYRLKGAE